MKTNDKVYIIFSHVDDTALMVEAHLDANRAVERLEELRAQALPFVRYSLQYTGLFD